MADPVHVGAYSANVLMAPSFRVRALLLRHDLAAAGVIVHPHPYGRSARSGRAPTDAAWSLVRARRALVRDIDREDVRISCAMILRQADYFPSLALERAVIRGRRFVFDVDDAIWTRDASGGSSRLAFLKGSARKARFLAAAADHVLAGNAILAEWLSEHNENVTVVPSLVDTGRVAIRRHVDADELVLGWIGSASTARYLDGLEPVLADVARRLPGRTIRLLTLGGKPSRRVDGIEYEAIPWSEAAEVGVLARIDVGLMPLPDTAWTRGKCAYKAIQYMAAGVPVVADAVGVTGDVVGQAPGLVCDGLQDWVDALVAFSTEPARSRAGAAGRERAVADFSNERWVPTIAAIIRGEL